MKLFGKKDSSKTLKVDLTNPKGLLTKFLSNKTIKTTGDIEVPSDVNVQKGDTKEEKNKTFQKAETLTEMKFSGNPQQKYTKGSIKNYYTKNIKENKEYKPYIEEEQLEKNTKTKEEKDDDKFEKAKKRVNAHIEKITAEESKKLDKKFEALENKYRAESKVTKITEEKTPEVINVVKPVEETITEKPIVKTKWETPKVVEVTKETEENKEEQKLKEELKKAIKENNEEEIKAIEKKFYKKFIKKEEPVLETKYEDNSLSSEDILKKMEKIYDKEENEKKTEEIIEKPTIEIKKEKDLQEELDTTRNKYASGYKQFLAERKKSSGWFTNVGRKVFGSKVKEEDTPQSLKDLEKDYEKATVEYGKKMYAEKETELKDSKLSAEEQKAELKRYKANEIFTKVIIEEQSTLNGLKVENLPPKEKGIIKKSLDWYTKEWFDESKSKIKWKNRLAKIAVATALSTGAIATFSPGVAVAAGGIAAYAGTRLARGLAGSIAGQTTSQIFEYSTKAYNWLFNKKTSTEKRETEEEELSKIFAEDSFDTSFAKNKKEYSEILEREKKAKRERLITKSLITLAAGGLASYEMGSALHHILPGQTLSSDNLHVKPTLAEHQAGGIKTETTNLPKHGGNYNETVKKGFQHEEIKENIFKQEGVKLNSRGAIQTINDLKEKINKDYPDISKAPASVQEFMKTNSTQEAIKLGMYAPGTTTESMMVQNGTLSFDEHGNLNTHYIDMKGIEHDQTLIQGQENAEVIEKYQGTMGHTGTSETHTTTGDTYNPSNQENPYAVPQQEDAITGENIGQNHINNSSEYGLPTQETLGTNIGVHDINHENIETINPIETKHIVNNVEIKNENELIKTRPEEIAHHPRNSMGGVRNMAHNYLLKNVTTTELLDKALSHQQLEQVNIMHENNINHIFPNEENTHAWYGIKDSHQLTADKILHTNIKSMNETYKPLILHFQKLHEVTGLEPIPQTAIQVGETPNEYLLRCEKFVILNGLQNKVKL